MQNVAGRHSPRTRVYVDERRGEGGEGVGVPQRTRAKNNHALPKLAQATSPHSIEKKAERPAHGTNNNCYRGALTTYTRGQHNSVGRSRPVHQQGCASPASTADSDGPSAAAAHQKQIGRASKGRHESSGRRTGAPTTLHVRLWQAGG